MRQKVSSDRSESIEALLFDQIRYLSLLIKILIALFLLEYPFEGVFGRTGGSLYIFIFLHQNNKKVLTTYAVSECLLASNILDPDFWTTIHLTADG